MALPSNKSSTSSTVAGRTSPSSRNSEACNPIRRSFAGNPFSKPSIVANPRSFNPITPANSPSDHPRRNSLSKESMLASRDYEEKENGKDQNSKPARVRSPTVAKSTKHFMSPTISAASKIAASQRKKILGDRNEPVRTSLSFSDLKSSSLNSVNPNPEEAVAAVETDPTPKTGPISNSTIEAPPPKASKTVRFADFEVISCTNDDSESQAETFLTEESDCVNLDPSFKISPISSPNVAPLDAALLMPPYDPKTNYLSPRPQFLHYRPNPRIERYLRKELDGTRLEDCFVSGSFSESEVTEETESESSQKESDEASSTEMAKEEEEAEEEEDEELHVSEHCPIAPIVPEEEIEVKMSSKPQSSKRFKISALFLLLLIGSFSIFVVNVHDPNILERPTLSIIEDPSRIYEFAKANYNGLVGKLKVWRANSISFISDLAFNIGGAPPLNYFNLTDFYEDVDGQCLVCDQTTQTWEEMEHMKEREVEVGIETVESESGRTPDSIEEEDNLNVVEPMKEREVSIETEERESSRTPDSIEEESFQEIEAIAEEAEENVEASDKLEEQAQEIVVNDWEEVEENHEISAHFETFDQSEPEAAAGKIDEEKSSQAMVADEVEEDVSSEYTAPAVIAEEQQSNTEFQYQSPASHSAEIQSDVEENGFSFAGAETDAELGEDAQTTAIMSALLFVIPLITLSGLVYARRTVSKRSIPVVEEQQQPPLLKKMMSSSPVEEEVMDTTTGESCSSEMSSFQYSMRGGGEAKGSTEAHSHGRKTRKNSRRESLASSSMDEFSVSASPSYGSFTTYERIPIKHGNGEEETVTPVRRSSRIRKQVTSP